LPVPLPLPLSAPSGPPIAAAWVLQPVSSAGWVGGKETRERDRVLPTPRDSAAPVTANTSSFQSEQYGRAQGHGCCCCWLLLLPGVGGLVVGEWREGSFGGLGKGVGGCWLRCSYVRFFLFVRNKTACPVMMEGPKSQICRQHAGSGLRKWACLSVVDENYKRAYLRALLFCYLFGFLSSFILHSFRFGGR
jgi:hypothetical protein